MPDSNLPIVAWESPTAFANWVCDRPSAVRSAAILSPVRMPSTYSKWNSAKPSICY